MLSKYFHYIKIKKNVFAIFNSLMMDVIYCNKDELLHIKNSDASYFSENELIKLYKSGIFVKNRNVDKNANELVRSNVIANTKDFVSLMYIIPTSECNLKCKYCFIGDICNDRSSIMSDEILYKALNEFSMHLKSKHIEQGQIIFYGGEPLMGMPIIYKAVDYIKQNKLNILLSMVSNATLINDELAQFLKLNDISIGISIDGPKSINDKNRIFKVDEGSSVYDRIIDKIEILKKYQVNFGLSITLTNEILNNEAEFVEWLKVLDVKNVCFNLMHYTEITDEWKIYYLKATKFLFKIKNKLPDVLEDRLNRKFTVFYKNNFKFSDCAAVGANQLCVANDGTITICHGYWNNKKHSCGSIFDGIDNIIKTDEYQLWNNNLTINKKKCEKCSAISICGGGCAMQAETLFGDLTSIDKAFCIHTKYVLKELLRLDYKNLYEIK